MEDITFIEDIITDDIFGQELDWFYLEEQFILENTKNEGE